MARDGRIRATALACALGLLVVGCATRRPAPVDLTGAAMARMARTRGAPSQELARTDLIRDPDHVIPAPRSARPGTDQPVAVAAVDGLALAPLRRAPATARPAGAPGFAWPVEGGSVSSRYGRRGRRHHDGIDISVPMGTRVLAAADGVVVYAGSVRGYGRMIILRHARGYDTVYAHNARHDVVAGRRVRRGQPIAIVGRTGRTTGPNLHFEIRKHHVAYDPLVFLPPHRPAVARGE